MSTFFRHRDPMFREDEQTGLPIKLTKQVRRRDKTTKAARRSEKPRQRGKEQGADQQGKYRRHEE